MLLSLRHGQTHLGQYYVHRTLHTSTTPSLLLTAAHCLLQHAMQDVCVVCVARGRIRPPATYMKMDTSTNHMIVKKYMSVWPAHHKHITSSTSQTNNIITNDAMNV